MDTKSVDDRVRQAKVLFRLGVWCSFVGGVWLFFVASPAFRAWCYEHMARGSRGAYPPDAVLPHIPFLLAWLSGAVYCFVRYRRLTRG